ncbi:MAG: HupE/UreJ family protein [Bacteriovoracaceae bacterium]|nr:HupE/UreJ family protein [Bacteriovoracaceae bacterium]
MYKLILSFIPLFWSANSFAHGISEDAKRAMIEGGYLKYIWLGAEHMITGYDHLLFLLGVIFFLTTFKDIVKFISIFTLGHSITLILATFMGITANYWLVDAVIAVSVCYKGFDNNNGFQNYFGMKKAPNLLMMVFIFGLIHGFGLSTRLQQLPLGEKGSEMLLRIISFNVGVELGQITALAIMLVLLSSIRKTEFFKRLSKVANDGIILAGFMLLLMQLHGYLHTSSPDEFGFSEDNHIHHHMKMNKPRVEKTEHDNL